MAADTGMYRFLNGSIKKERVSETRETASLGLKSEVKFSILNGIRK